MAPPEEKQEPEKRRKKKVHSKGTGGKKQEKVDFSDRRQLTRATDVASFSKHKYRKLIQNTSKTEEIFNRLFRKFASNRIQAYTFTPLHLFRISFPIVRPGTGARASDSEAAWRSSSYKTSRRELGMRRSFHKSPGSPRRYLTGGQAFGCPRSKPKFPTHHHRSSPVEMPLAGLRCSPARGKFLCARAVDRRVKHRACPRMPTKNRTENTSSTKQF